MTKPHVLVTGASRGIGLAVAERLLSDGAMVTVVARNAAALADLAEAHGGATGRCRVLARDLAELDDFDELVAAVTGAGELPLTGVVHAAGTQLRKPAIEVEEAEFARILRIHVTVPFLLSTAIARAQIAAGAAGSHVFIGSLGSHIAVPGAAPYTAAKSAVLGVVHSLATELAPHGIRANAVDPGYVETELTADLLKIDAQRNRILNRTPLGRLGRPEEIASVVAFLLGDDATYVTGEDIRVDGGWLAS